MLETTPPIVVEFHMKHDQNAGFQNCKIGLGRESKMGAITKKIKITKSIGNEKLFKWSGSHDQDSCHAHIW